MPFPEKIRVIQDEDDPSIMIIAEKGEIEEGQEYGIYSFDRATVKKIRKRVEEEVQSDVEGV
jgi:hypothetical protein